MSEAAAGDDNCGKVGTDNEASASNPPLSSITPDLTHIKGLWAELSWAYFYIGWLEQALENWGGKPKAELAKAKEAFKGRKS